MTQDYPPQQTPGQQGYPQQGGNQPQYGGGPPAGGPGSGQQGPSRPRADFGKRAIGAIIDTVIVTVVYFILASIVGAVLSSSDDAGVLGAGLGVIILLSIVIGVGYYVVLEGGESGQTLGKKAMGIRVIDLQTGGPLGYGKAFLRLLGRYVSSIPCYLGFLWMLWDQDQATWHDKLSNTAVVPTS